MTNLTQVTLSGGIPTAGDGTVSTIDALIVTAGLPADAANTATDGTPVSQTSILKQISASTQGVATTLAAGATAANQASQITQETAINTVLGVKTDAKSTATDATSISAMSVWKQISASVQAIATGGGGSAVTLADGANTTQGSKADAKNAATDTTSITIMSVLKQISFSMQALASVFSGGINANGQALMTGSAPVVIASNQSTLPVQDVRSATGTPASVAGSVTSVSLLSANTSRLGATVYNDSTATLYLLLASSSASTTSYTVQVLAGGYYEVPFKYTGQLTGIWASATGNARVTELT